MENLQSLLTSITRLIRQHKTISQEKHKNGESFNTFNILNLRTDEVRLHSAFIAELLSKDGSHGMNDSFLRSFCNIVMESENSNEGETNLTNPIEKINYSKAKIQTEFYIESVSKTKGGRIDIHITDGTYCIVIENKLSAKDQPRQLVRYNNYAKQFSTKDENRHCVIYLTLEGYEASKEATSNRFTNKDYIRISYHNTILQWLQQCAQLAYNKPLVRESIIQYSDLVKQITNQTLDMKTEEKILNTSCTLENIEAVMTIINQRDPIIQKAVEKYLSPKLNPIAKKYNLEVEDNFNTSQGRLNYQIQFTHPNWSSKKYIIFQFEYTKLQGFYWGFCRENRVNGEHFDCFNEDAVKHYPHGWSWCEGFNDWNDPETFVKVINGELARYIDKCLGDFTEILEEKSLNI